MNGAWDVITKTVTVSAGGAATVTFGSKLNGRVFAIKYVPGTLDTGADLTFVGATSGVPILTVANAGTSTVWWFPAGTTNKVADGTAATSEVPVYVWREAITLTVAQGGNATSGTVTIYIWQQDSIGP